MKHEATDDIALEERRNNALLTYLEALEAGQDPDCETLFAEFPELRDEIDTFLADHQRVARITAPLRKTHRVLPKRRDSVAMEDAREIASPLGELGDYRLMCEVGRGGMGVVYEAEQISLRRRVALKVLPFVAAIDPRRLQRFKTEAMAAAHLHHEKIVPVYSVGCERGVHYYAMQFIDGQSLATLIEELRALPVAESVSSSPLDTIDENTRSVGENASSASTISNQRSADRHQYVRRMAELARQAAAAVEHAHQAGVVHRDIKPGNLLLDLRGQLWVTDFGLAQVTGDAGLTFTGEMLGTLRYASPEQVMARRGVIDHRSDIYSLGATLYELLTLRPPFDGEDRTRLIRQIVEEEPESPRFFDPAIPSALETIVLKTLRKQPGDRYATAQELCDDLERFLDGRPIAARPPSGVDRFFNWSRRHPAIVGTTGVAMTLLCVASLVSAVLIGHEQSKTLAEQRKVQDAYIREHQRANEAEARFRLARRAVDELIRTSEEELAHRPGMEGLRKRLLTSALVYYREFIDERRDDPNAQAQLLDTSRKVETILADLAVLRASNELFLLAQQTALDDLRLNAAQRKKVSDLSARSAKRWSEAFGDPNRVVAPSDRAKRTLALAKTNSAEIDAILKPQQRVRLRQIALQAEGPGAFREPEVVENLSLTPPQREQIRSIEEEAFFRQIREMRAGKTPEDTAKSSVERILAVLDAGQIERWSLIIGEPVRGPLSAFPMPFRPNREAAKPAGSDHPARPNSH